MEIRKIIMYLFIFLINGFNNKISAQETVVSRKTTDSAFNTLTEQPKFKFKNLIVPAVFISYGVASLKIQDLKQLNFSTRDEILEDNTTRLHWDNYTQYAPVFLVYGLKAGGIESKHSFRELTILYATSQLISAAFVVPLKHIVKEERPDGSNFLSFPSGHTATAFSSAHFMFREFKDTNFWLSISGYSFAVFTGVYRTINNKHWVGDVVAGAGFGILSTELAYWAYPKIKAVFSGKQKKFQSW